MTGLCLRLGGGGGCVVVECVTLGALAQSKAVVSPLSPALPRAGGREQEVPAVSASLPL